MNNKELLLFQIGPVQEFIAQAANVGDLWAGSYLISNLMWTGLQEIPEKESAVIFPDLSTDIVRKSLEEDKIPTIPNRFLAWVESGKGKAVAEKIKKTIKLKLDEYVQSLELDEKKKAAAKVQSDQFLQMSYAVLNNPTGTMGRDYKSIGKLLAMRRNVREFEPWKEIVATGKKDFLSGKETAIKDGRGAMNLIKVKLAKENGKGDILIDGQYLAVIAMDGDKMGETLSSFENEQEHRKFSSSLAEFAGKVESVIREFKGCLIYDGGDDVLAVVPVKQAIDCTKRLRTLFGDTVKGKDGKALTSSVGIAVGHKSVPMQDLVHKAHAAESRAKLSYGRDAIAMSVFKRSGEIIEWGSKSTSKAFDIFSKIRESIENNTLSNRFPYKLAELLHPYGHLNKNLHNVIKMEFEHAWERSSNKKAEDSLVETVREYFCEVFDGDGKAEDFLNLFLCETFINRPREGEER